MTVSLIIPIYNEVENIPLLHQQLCQALQNWDHEFEMIFVDDGSTDGSAELLSELAHQDDRVRVVQFRRNYGQTAAMQAGFDHASGEILVTLDGDLQNDPSDIPMMVSELQQGPYDLIHGWRKNRQDKLITRKIPSRIANWLISCVTGFPIHDLGCTLKAMRREIAEDLELYGEMHRFIPILAHWKGACCKEVVTRHHARKFGTTKYGLSRTFRVLLDLMTVKFLLKYSTSPMKLFGMIGLGCAAGSVLSGLTTLGMKFLGGVDMTGNPLLLLTALFAMAAIQFFSMGLLGELGSRMYFGSSNRCHYTIRDLKNFDRTDDEPQRLMFRRSAA